MLSWLYLIALHFSYQQVYAARPVAFTNYTFAESGPFFNLDTYIAWESAPDSGYIYPAFQFFFQANQGGYMGIQLVGDTKKAIFSIWDMSEGSGTAQPVTDICFRFGHEGSGTGCIIDYDWVEGREYRLRIWEINTDATGESWIGVIADTVTNQETVIGVIHLQNSGGYTGYGWLRCDTYTFLEYFGGADSCDGQPYSRILWRGPFANADWYTASRAIVPTYNACSSTNVTTRGRPTAIHEAGIGVQRTTPAGTILWDTSLTGTLHVEVASTYDDPVVVELEIDGSKVSTRTVSPGETVSFGDFALTVDHHLVAAVWTDPLTAESRRVETIEAIPVDGTINTLLRVWPIASRLYLPIVLHRS